MGRRCEARGGVKEEQCCTGATREAVRGGVGTTSCGDDTCGGGASTGSGSRQRGAREARRKVGRRRWSVGGRRGRSGRERRGGLVVTGGAFLALVALSRRGVARVRGGRLSSTWNSKSVSRLAS